MLPDNKTPPPTIEAKPLAVGSERAPFVYCDGVLAYGISGGLIQIELAANTLRENGDDGVRTEVVVTAHLRCSPTAAQGLKRALDEALAMIERAEVASKVFGGVFGKPN
jgi:hypothetical protein